MCCYFVCRISFCAWFSKIKTIDKDKNIKVLSKDLFVKVSIKFKKIFNIYNIKIV